MVEIGELRRDEGSAVVETAIVLPTYFLLLFGIFTMSLVLFGYDNATYAARAAARYASMHSGSSLQPCNVSCVQTYATQYLYAAPTSGTTIGAVYGTTNTVGSTVTVSIGITYNTMIPYWKNRALTIQSSASRTISR